MRIINDGDIEREYNTRDLIELFQDEVLYLHQYSGHLLRRKMIDRSKKSNSSIKVQVEPKYQMNCSMDIVQNLLAKVGNLANRNASS